MSSIPQPRYNKQVLSLHLRQLANEAIDVDPKDGDPITRAHKLAQLLWDKALGGTKMERNDQGQEVQVYNRPESWAIQLVYDRLEGRVPNAADEDADRPRALERLREIARERVNAITAKASASIDKKLRPSE